MNHEPWQWREKFPAEWLPENLSIEINAKTVDEQFDRLRGYMQTLQVYRAGINEIKTKLETLDSEFRVRYEHNPIHHVEDRLKSPQSIMEKMRRKGLPMTLEAARENLLDIAGVRVVCSYLEDIYRIADILEKQTDITPVRRRDYIAEPKENGYRSLHLIVKVPVFLSDHQEHVPVEVQIRTIAMDFWATLEHELRYKSTVEMSDALRARLKQSADQSAALDVEMQAIRNLCIKQEEEKG